MRPQPPEPPEEKRRKNSLKENIELIKGFFPYLKEHIPTLTMVLLCTAFSAACEIVLPLIVREITNTATSSLAALTLQKIVKVCLFYIVLRGIGCLTEYVKSYHGHVMGVKIENKMRADMFDHLQTLSFNFFDNTKVGQLMSRMTSDLFDVAEWAHHFPEMIFTTVVKFFASFYIFTTMDYRLALCVFILMPFMVILTKKSRGRMRDAFRRSRHQVGEINARLEDSLLGVRVVRSFTNEETEREKFLEGCAEYVSVKNTAHKYMSSFHSMVTLIDGIMYIVVVGVGAYFMHLGEITPGDFAASLLLVSTLLGSIRTIVDFSEQFSRGITGIERFREIMDVQPDITDSENAVEIGKAKGDIEFRDVTFSYVKGEKKILSGLDLHLKAGENLALVGPSGGGKTTLCNLIPRFYDPEEGRITIDGTDIRDFTRVSLRRNVGIVAQDVFLFDGSIADNIRYGNLDATEEEVIEAAKKARIHDYVMTLEEGYDTQVGERGVKLSGGQKQRISIARVFLKDPGILILDEATSALDNQTEMEIQQELFELAKGRTCIIVAHRLSTIKSANEIVVLTPSGIAERGSHRELMALGGIYANLYNYQIIDL